MRDLLVQQADDACAAEAVELFCYQIKKWTGAFAAAMGGLDTLVFTGGIGEPAPQGREWICSQLEFPGIEMGKIQCTKCGFHFHSNRPGYSSYYAYG